MKKLRAKIRKSKKPNWPSWIENYAEDSLEYRQNLTTESAKLAYIIERGEWSLLRLWSSWSRKAGKDFQPPIPWALVSEIESTSEGVKKSHLFTMLGEWVDKEFRQGTDAGKILARAYDWRREAPKTYYQIHGAIIGHLKHSLEQRENALTQQELVTQCNLWHSEVRAHFERGTLRIECEVGKQRQHPANHDSSNIGKALKDLEIQKLLPKGRGERWLTAVWG